MKKKSTETDRLKKQLTTKTESNTDIPERDFLSMGSTLFNLSCSDYASGAIAKGSYVLLVGDTDTLKTWSCLTCMAEACQNPAFDNHRLIYDGPEGGAKMNIQKFFGTKLDKRLEIIEPSEDLEGFYYSVDSDLDEGTPFIRILDSITALGSEDDEKTYQKSKEAYEKGKTDEKGSYNLSTPKQNSMKIKRLVSKLNKSESILIIINQVRSNIGTSAMFKPDVVPGGRALPFYADLQVWMKPGEPLKKKVGKYDRQIGHEVKIIIKRSRYTGKKREIIIPVYHSYGMDDIGSSIDYLVREGHWKKGKQTINAREFHISATKDKLISWIEEKEGALARLRKIVGHVWSSIEAASNIKRKKRYT